MALQTWCLMPLAGPVSRSRRMDVRAVVMTLASAASLLSWSRQYDRHHPARLCRRPKVLSEVRSRLIPQAMVCGLSILTANKIEARAVSELGR